MTTIDTTIADQVAVLRRNAAGRLPAAVAAVFGAELTRLDAAGVPLGIAAVGTAMPDRALLNVQGQPTTLVKVRGGKPAVVVFYRGAWCPYCNLTLRTYQQTLVPELDGCGVALIAISPQKPDGSLSMQEKHALTYRVVSDPGNQIAGQLGILTAPGEEVRQTQVAHGLDLTAINADGTSAIPMPTVVIVDGAGTIRWIDVHPNYTTRSEPGEILDALAATIGQKVVCMA
ncbi:MAG TPA: peroxiredoxin-like family protein, partial [Chloroflexota bacterium]